MSTCIREGCDYQHGLVERVCGYCHMADELNGMSADELTRVLSRVQTPPGTPLFGVGASFDRYAGNTPAITGYVRGDYPSNAPGEPKAWPTAAMRRERTWPGAGHGRTAEAPVPDECVQPACPTDSFARALADAEDVSLRQFVREGAPDRRLTLRWRAYAPAVRDVADRCNAFWSRDLSREWMGWDLSRAENQRILRARHRAHALHPNQSMAKRCGCACLWAGEGSIIHFEPGCPILTEHRGVPEVVLAARAEADA